MPVRSLRIILLFVFGFFAAIAFAADSPFVGTWKLNAEKSKMSGADALQNVTVKYDIDGKQLKASVDATDTQGQPVSISYEAGLDGKAGTATGSKTFDTILIHELTASSMRVTAKKGDKVVYTDRRTVSKDGKTLTISRTGRDSAGKAYHSTIVFDKQ